MTGVSAWEAVLRVVRGVSAVDDLDQFGPVVLQQIGTLIPSDLVSYNEVDPLAGRALVLSHPGRVTDEELEVWQTWAHQNPSLMHVLRTGDGSARRISDFITQDELHELELYRHGYGPLGVEYQLSVALPAPRPLIIGIALNRGDRDFTDEEVALLDALRPHLVQAYRQAQLITEHRRALSQVAGLLEQEGKAFHVIGDPLDDRAQSLLGRYFSNVPGTLPGPVSSWIDDERGRRDQLRRPLVSDRDGRRLTLQYVPGPGGRDLLWMVERPTEVSAEPLEKLGLTRREAEVLWLLTQGRSTADIGRHLEISAGTAKKHLERVYRKLGVSSATAAVAAAFDVLTL